MPRLPAGDGASCILRAVPSQDDRSTGSRLPIERGRVLTDRPRGEMSGLPHRRSVSRAAESGRTCVRSDRAARPTPPWSPAPGGSATFRLSFCPPGFPLAATTAWVAQRFLPLAAATAWVARLFFPLATAWESPEGPMPRQFRDPLQIRYQGVKPESLLISASPRVDSLSNGPIRGL